MQTSSLMEPLLQLTGLDKLTVQMLKRELGHRGLPVHGRKHELQRRLLRATVQAGLSEPGDADPVKDDRDAAPDTAALRPCGRRRLSHPRSRRFTARSRGRLRRWAAEGDAAAARDIAASDDDQHSGSGDEDDNDH